MKTETRELLGFKVPVVGVAETMAELVTASGSEAEVVDTNNNQVFAHSHATILRRAIIKKLVELTGIKQLTIKEGDKEVLDEKDAAYIGRLEEELGEGALKKYEGQIASTCQAIPMDYTPGVRGSGGSAAPAKKWLAYYDQLVAEEKLDIFCQKHSIDQSVDADSLKNTVANKVREIVTAAQAEASKAALAV